MKIIDLLNKIANGEEVPKKIKFNNEIFNFKKDIQNYSTVRDGKNVTLDSYLLIYSINEEVEIIEEENKIPEKLNIVKEKNCKNNWKWKVKGEEYYYNISTPQKIIADKVNQLIDYLNSKGE